MYTHVRGIWKWEHFINCRETAQQSKSIGDSAPTHSLKAQLTALRFTTGAATKPNLSPSGPSVRFSLPLLRNPSRAISAETDDSTSGETWGAVGGPLSHGSGGCSAPKWPPDAVSEVGGGTVVAAGASAMSPGCVHPSATGVGNSAADLVHCYRVKRYPPRRLPSCICPMQIEGQRRG